MAGGRTVTGPARAHGTRHGGRRWRRPSGRSVRSSTGRLSDRSATSFRHRAVPALRPLSPSPRAEGPWSKSGGGGAGWGGHRRMTGDGGGLLRGNLLDGPASPQGSWTSPACAGTSWTLGTRSHADRPPRPGCTGGSPRPEPAEGRQQGPKAADPRRVGPAAGRQTRAGPGRSAAVRVRVRTRAPRVATNVIRSAACPVRSYLHTPIGSRHSGPRPQRRGRSRSKVPRTRTFGPRPGAGPTPGVRVHGERRDRAAIAAARRRGPGRRPPARGGVTGGGRAVFGAGGRRRAATAAPVVRTGSAPPSPTRRAA